MSKKNLLVVDDSVTIQKVFELAFENEDIHITLADDGEAALELIRADTPDLVIADVNMPGVDGFELCRRMQEDPALAAIPVYLLVSSLDEFDNERATDVGATGRFEKPFRSDEMVSHVYEAFANVAATDALTGVESQPANDAPTTEEAQEAAPALESQTVEDPPPDDDFEDIGLPLERLDADLDLFITKDEQAAPEAPAAEPVETIDEIPEPPDIDEDTSPSVIIEAHADTPQVIELRSDALTEEELSDDERLALEVVSDEDEDPVEAPVVTGGLPESSLADDGPLNPDQPSTRTGLPASVEMAAIDVVSIDDDGTPYTHDISLSADSPETAEREMDDDDELSPEARELLRAIDAEAGELGDEEEGELRARERMSSPSEEKDERVEELTAEPAPPTISEERIEAAINEAVQRVVERMEPQILSSVQKVAEDVTLRVAEDLVRQTIEQIRTADEG